MLVVLFALFPTCLPAECRQVIDSHLAHMSGAIVQLDSCKWTKQLNARSKLVTDNRVKQINNSEAIKHTTPQWMLLYFIL